MFRPKQAIIRAILHRNTGKLLHVIYTIKKFVWCVAVRSIKIVKCVGVKTLKYQSLQHKMHKY